MTMQVASEESSPCKITFDRLVNHSIMPVSMLIYLFISFCSAMLNLLNFSPEQIEYVTFIFPPAPIIIIIYLHFTYNYHWLIYILVYTGALHIDSFFPTA